MSENNTVVVICGANKENVAPGQTIAQVREGLGDALNIPEDAMVLVSGDRMEDTYRLQEGDQVEFIRPSGDKG